MKIVNLRKEFSPFLGINFKAVKNRNKLTIGSYVFDKAIDLSFIYNKVKYLYNPYNTESIDSIVLFKINYDSIYLWNSFYEIDY